MDKIVVEYEAPTKDGYLETRKKSFETLSETMDFVRFINSEFPHSNATIIANCDK